MNINLTPKKYPKYLKIISYNINNNGKGGDGWRNFGLQPIIEICKDYDIVLLQEVIIVKNLDNKIIEDGFVELREGLNMYGEYFIEQTDIKYNNKLFTVGNAIYSKYPIQKSTLLKFNKQTKSERNAGFILIGNILITNVHLSSGISSMRTRWIQTQEILNYSNKLKKEWGYVCHIIGGDFNAPLSIPYIGSIPSTMFFHGYYDTHINIPFHKRKTIEPAKYKSLCVYDYFYTNSKTNVIEYGECNSSNYRGWSDHLPIWINIQLY